MLEINLNNIEKLLFYNRKVQVLLPEHTFLFDQWRLTRLLPSMRPVTKRAALQLLEAITDEQLDRLSTHFGMPVTLDRGGHKLAKNHEFLLDEAEFRLDDADLFQQIAITRDADTVYISSWR